MSVMTATLREAGAGHGAVAGPGARRERRGGRRRGVAGEVRWLRPAPPALRRVPGLCGVRGVGVFGAVMGLKSPLVGVFRELMRAAVTPHPILLVGETGVGKEVVAKAVHAASGRKGPLITINCGALPAGLAEAELFGHVRGAFTGAGEGREGAFLAAQGGTLFLDELGELPDTVQPKLLRALEGSEIRPVGSARCLPVDVRVVAATNRELEQDIAQGRFRADLLYRLDMFRFVLPPLRERWDDLAVLAPALARGLPGGACVTDEVFAVLKRYDWPGNVRELRNVLGRANLSGRGVIREADVALALRGRRARRVGRISADPGGGRHPKECLLAERLLMTYAGNVRAVSRELGIPRSTLYRWMNRGWIRRP